MHRDGAPLQWERALHGAVVHVDPDLDHASGLVERGVDRRRKPGLAYSTRQGRRRVVWACFALELRGGTEAVSRLGLRHGQGGTFPAGHLTQAASHGPMPAIGRGPWESDLRTGRAARLDVRCWVLGGLSFLGFESISLARV